MTSTNPHVDNGHNQVYLFVTLKRLRDNLAISLASDQSEHIKTVVVTLASLLLPDLPAILPWEALILLQQISKSPYRKFKLADDTTTQVDWAQVDWTKCLALVTELVNLTT